MGKKVGLTLQDVVDAATTIADRDGLEAASLSAVANELRIKTPSMYNHVAGLAGLRRELALHAAREFTEVFAAAVVTDNPDRTVRQIANAFRSFATEHPGMYAALSPAPRPGEDDELYEAMAGPVIILAEALASLGVAAEDAIHVIRGMRATLHGFVDLEANGGFGMPVDIDTSFDRAVDAMVDGLQGAQS